MMESAPPVMRRYDSPDENRSPHSCSCVLLTMSTSTFPRAGRHLWRIAIGFTLRSPGVALSSDATLCTHLSALHKPVGRDEVYLPRRMRVSPSRPIPNC